MHLIDAITRFILSQNHEGEMYTVVTCVCGKRLRADNMGGMRVRCPACKNLLTIPDDQVPEFEAIEEVEDDHDAAAYGVNAKDAKLEAILPGQGDGGSRFAGGVGMIRLDGGNAATCLAYGHGRTRGLAGQGRTVFVLNMKTGKRASRFKKHEERISCVAFAPDDALALSGDSDGELILWEPEFGDIVHRLRWHREPVTGAAFSPDGKLAASCDEDGNVCLWKLESGKRLKLDHARRPATLSGVAFSPDGSLLAAWGVKGQALLWAVEDGKLTRTLKGAAGSVDSMAFTSDSEALVAVGLASFTQSGLTVVKWNTRTGQKLECFENPSHNRATVHCAVVVPGGQYILSAGRLPKEEKKGEHDRGGILETAGLLDDSGFIAGLLDYADEPRRPWGMQVWSVSGGMITKTMEDTNRSDCLAVSADAQRALAAADDGTVSVWSLPC